MGKVILITASLLISSVVYVEQPDIYLECNYENEKTRPLWLPDRDASVKQIHKSFKRRNFNT